MSGRVNRPWDAVVIGAGLVGASAAAALAARGRRVLVLERFERGHLRGSSHGASRIFRQGYPVADYVDLSARALAGWRALEERSGRSLLDPTGAIDSGDSADLAAIEAAMRDGGAPVERLDAAEAGRRWTGLRFDGDVLLGADGGRIRSADAIETLLDTAVADGAELRFGARVVGLEETADGIRLTVAVGGPHAPGSGDVGLETVEAEVAVAAVGSWAHPVVGDWFAERGSPLPPILVEQVQPAHFPALDTAAVWPSFVVYRDGRSLYGLETPGEGIKVGWHGGGVATTADDRDFAVDGPALDALLAIVRELVPGVDAGRPELISCLYDIAPGEDFALDRRGPLVVATGMAGHGFKFGPALGELLAGLATGAEDAPPVPERFRLR